MGLSFYSTSDVDGIAKPFSLFSEKAEAFNPVTPLSRPPLGATGSQRRQQPSFLLEAERGTLRPADLQSGS
jgi:hypothetical protein